MKILVNLLKGDWVGIHFAVNIFIATSLLWLILRAAAGLDPIWAISSMIAASDPNVKQAVRTFWGRITNAAVGCATGLVFLVIGGERAWNLPLCLAVTVLLNTYVVRVQTMWRQAPITAALIIAAGLTRHSELRAIEVGIRRVAEVMLGCVIGLGVAWLMSKIWPLDAEPGRAAVRP
ncbi:MAG TPA: FUSC family protein [Candidatus Methylomirabilis sp.]|nr:FUSC family protein [Candidatus Methylomirabilis sp.]